MLLERPVRKAALGTDLQGKIYFKFITEMSFDSLYSISVKWNIEIFLELGMGQKHTHCLTFPWTRHTHCRYFHRFQT